MQAAELVRLRKQALTGDDSGALAAYHTRSQVCITQAGIKEDYGQFTSNFNDLLDFTFSMDDLPKRIKFICSMSNFIKEGIDRGRIDPQGTIVRLEKLEKQSSYRPPSQEGNINLDPLRIMIGEFMFLTHANDGNALRRYQQCKDIQPQATHWPRAIALCHMETLHWSLAEDSLVEARAIDPSDEETKKAIAHLLHDKLEFSSLVLEWTQAFTSNSEKEDKRSALSKIVNIVAGFLNHPTLQKRILPSVIPTKFRSELIEELNKNGTGLHAANLIGKIAVLFTACLPDKKALKVAAQVFQKATGYALTGVHLFRAYTKFQTKPNQFSRNDVVGVVVDVLTHAPEVIPTVQSLVYKDAEKKRESQKAHPYLSTVVEVVAAPQFPLKTASTMLVVHSSDFVGRFTTRLTGVRSSMIRSFVNAIAIAYFFDSLICETRKAYAKITETPGAEPQEPARSGFSYLTDWTWGKFLKA